MRFNIASVSIIICVITSSNVFALNTLTASTEKQTKIGITIYNNNLALIKDTRTMTLQPGHNRVDFEDVSAKIRPETASLTTIEKKNAIELIEQNFDYDLLTPKKLLDKYIGREIKIIRTNPATGNESQLKATVLATNNGVVLQVGNHIETGMPDRILFPNLPENLRSKPTLTIDLLQHSKSHPSSNIFELSYLSSGFGWKADYVAHINKLETYIDLNAWVTLTNQSGNSYHNAQLQLIAGDINQVSTIRYERQKLRRNEVSLASVSQTKEEPLLDYHLYSLANKTDLLDNQTKQVALFSRNKIPIKKIYRAKGNSHFYHNRYNTENKKRKTEVIIQFVNDKPSNLALPLPKGIIRSYKNDTNNNLQFVGEDKIEHTANKETISLKLGNAFDISSSKQQLNFNVISKNNNARHTTESEYKITANNAKDTAVILILEEPIPGEWVILDESLSHKKIDSSTAQWKLPIPANGKTTLHYKVRIIH